MDNFDWQVEQDTQNVEYQTISSGCSIDKIDRPDRLHEWLKPVEIEQLHNYFQEKKKLSYTELRDILLSLNITFTDFEYNRLFLKINQNRDFKCDWNEFISYLIFGFQEDDPAGQKELLILPIAETPEVRKSEHKSAVCCISLIKKAGGSVIDNEPKKDIEDDDGEIDEAAEKKKKMEEFLVGESSDVMGIWLTGSKEGQVRFWTPQLDLLRSGLSESIHLKMSTWILCIQALSDVSIVCTSSTERELRFHEIVASNFILRIVIRSMPYAVCCMAYSFGPKSHSRLILGDFGGNIRVLEYDPYLRGPFQSKPGAALIEVFWSDILKGKLPLFIVREYSNVHTEHIQKVFYSLRMNSLFSAAEYRNTKKYRGRCPGLIVNNGDDKTVFRIPLGVTTFFVDEKNNLVVTGGPDTFVRVWDAYIPSEPSGILTGHNGGIVMVFVQSEEKMAYSVDYQKIIKVWDVTEFVLLQTFGDLVRILSGETDLVYYYHVSLRTLMVGGRKLVTVKCNPRIRVDLTDGNTHAAPVSVVLYNRLFRNVVTCGLDSYIIVWDPWTGRRKIIMKNCHTKQVYGEHIDIEITAACFDPLEQFLLTGARDGSLKIWNYNNAVCIRNMSIKPEHEVTSVIWVVERILAVGWDKQVTEFNDAEGSEYSDPKKWPMFHTDDITCADVKLGEGVVTATYSGELIFWRLETGQPYRRYSVSAPNEFIELKHFRDIDDSAKPGDSSQGHHFSISHYVRKSVSVRIRDIEKREMRRGSFTGKRLDDADETEEALLKEVKNRKQELPMSVQAVLFLQTRPMTNEHGSVFVALETGVIQVFSHHQRGGYITQFIAIHKTGDCVLTMATDRHNRFLFTGTAFGYIKTWYIENYGIPERDKVKVCMPLLRLQFIFLRNEIFMPRAKRAIRHQKEPLLVSSHKGHLKAITSIVYINLPKILITGSYDCSCRLWSLGGRYLGTLGTPLPWMKLSPFEPVEEEVTLYRIPPDIQKVASSTTMKIISGHIQDRFRVIVNKVPTNEENEFAEEGDGLYAKPLREPILGKHFGLPGLSAAEQRINLDTHASYTPVFTHLKIHEASDLVKPPTPPTIRRVANENYMDFYEPTIKKDVPKEEIMKPRKRTGGKGFVAFSKDAEKKEHGQGQAK